MKIAVITILFLWSNFSYSQSSIGSKDPCYSDINSLPCREKINKAIFFMTTVDGTVRPEESSYVNAYLEKHGFEGFKVQASQYHPGSLLVFTLDHSVHTKFNKKLITAFPKGETVDGKNIFDIVIKETPPFRRESILKAYIANLNLLFPVDGNEDFQKTKDQFGLPWEDPHFPQKYVDRIQSMVTSIDHGNDFFKRNEYQAEKKEFQEIIARIQQLQEIPAKACAVTQYEEFVEISNKYGNILNSSNENPISCMIKNGKFDLAQKIININGCEDKRLPAYFDQAVALKETSDSFEFSQFLYMKLSHCSVKINPVKGEGNRDFLQRASVYLNKYKQEEIICDTHIHEGTTIDNLSKNLDQILYAQAYQLMEQILDEKDPNKKAELIDQFISLKGVGVKLGNVNPSTGKTILHLIAEVGDYELFEKLLRKGINPGMLGHKVLDKNGKTPLIVAIESGKLNQLKFASSLYKAVMYFNKDELNTIKNVLKKTKADDKESKKLKKSFIREIKDKLFDA